jgi:hypothetical protein
MGLKCLLKSGRNAAGDTPGKHAKSAEVVEREWVGFRSGAKE